MSCRTHLTTGTFTSGLPSMGFNFRNLRHELVPRTGWWSEKPVYNRILIFSTRHVGGRLIYAGQWHGDDEIIIIIVARGVYLSVQVFSFVRSPKIVQARQAQDMEAKSLESKLN